MRRLLAALGLCALLAHPAAASTEEFTSFDVAHMEEDDENFLDHWCNRTPDAWLDEFAGAPMAFHTSQGCYTSGLWFMRTDFKARVPTGDRSWLELNLQDVQDDIATWQYLRFDFRWPTKRAGTFGLRFQPSRYKSEHDFALLWDAGAPGAPLRGGAAFTVPDAFNSFWEFRQSRVGDHWEPYHAHPVLPSLWLDARGRHHRVRLDGKWLTPLGKDVHDPTPTVAGNYGLWGAEGSARADLTFAPWTLELRAEDEQVRQTESHPAVAGSGSRFRARWQGEVALRRELSPHWRAEARWGYQDRRQDWRIWWADASFRGLDRGLAFEVSGELRKDWRLRLGVLHDRIGIDTTGTMPDFTWGTRKESRAFVGLQARFGRIHVQGIEGIELDSEPYDVSLHHDKGFLQLQTTF